MPEIGAVESSNITTSLDKNNQAKSLERLFNQTSISSLTDKELVEIINFIDLNKIIDFSKTEKFIETLEVAQSLKIKETLYNNVEEDLARFTTTKINKILSIHKSIAKDNLDNEIYTTDITHSIHVLSLLFELSYRIKIYAHSEF